MIKRTTTKKVSLDIEKFLDASGFLFQLNKKSILKFDFSCIFEKDFTLVQKREINKQFGYNGLVKLLGTMIGLHKHFEREFGVKLRKDIKVTHGSNFQWGATVIKQKKK